MDGRFTDEELAIAKSVDLCAVAESLGYTVKRIGKYHTLKEMDSIRIYNRSHWYRWSRQFDKGNNGGSQIDFLRVFCGMSVKEAVFWLLDFAGYRRIEKPVKQPLVHQVSQKQAEERKPFVLPELAGDNSYLISYLNQERGISRTVIDLFLKDGLIYESRHYHNVVFKGNDKNGVTRFASMRGVFDKQGKPFKCDVTGNDKNYGFNVVNVNSTELVVFEAAIDLMSYVDIWNSDFRNQAGRSSLAKESTIPPENFKMFFKEQVTSFTEDNKFNGNLKITIGENKFDLKVPFQTLRTGSEGEICNVWDLMEDYYSESGDNSNIKNFLGNMSVFTRWYAYETRINDIFGDYEVSHN